jgi:2-polyprenyl-3-methyl-5-hydroxy-6-metoxy-1,4-benzoquinol methylase
MQMFETAGEHAKSELEKLVVAASIANIRSSLFDAWHWRMINDAKRNNKFAAAIQEALKTRPNALVLDIGCGSGIFSVVAARLAHDFDVN